MALACIAAWLPSRALGIGTLAGTPIQNTARVTYTIGGTQGTTNSNTVSLTVAELIDVVATVQSGDVSVTPGATNQVIVVRVTNTGNGSESFRLTLTSALGGDQFDPIPATPAAIYFDTDNSGTLTPADVPYSPGNNDPTLAPDAFVTVLLVHDIPAAPPLLTGDRGLARLTAEARTGTGAPGTTFPGQGAGGSDAIVGLTGGDSDATGAYLVSDIAVTANKTAAVVDPFGGSRPIPGARIDFQVVVTATGPGTAGAAQFTDNIPANTTYVPNSLRLNGASLTDAADADAGQFVANPVPQVRVALGSLTQASGAQTIRFSVTIN
ncbi:MAG: hypothetical protein NZM12_07495 [Steroidobacteraceae bacterium]|nr:hypothetical protein [Steroidobacteraceae bacterium]MDW8259153.1 hypothetical protein [Gammaproteobacteria bacterium]